MRTPDLHHHGDAELAPGLLDLAVNVRRGPLPPWLASAVLSACARLDAYPDPRAATGAVAARHGRAAGEVLLTAGAVEAFTLVAQGLPQGLPRGRAAIVHPQFTEPEVALRAAGWDVARVLVRPGEPVRPQDVPDCELVVVGNPTNPTGTLHPVAALRRAGRLLVVDEAFMDAVPGEPSSLAGAADLTGVLVVRSLTKTWGLAGLRAGYLLGDAAAIAACARVQPRWSVSAPALAATVACMTPQALDQANARAVELSRIRDELRSALHSRGFELVDGAVVPFLLTRHPDRPDLHAELRGHGIAVRRADTFPGLDAGWVRISVRDRPANERLLRALDGRPGGAPGSVTLVGGGPGASGQITVDGLLALQRADVVVTDRLAPLSLLDPLPPHVEVVDAAKHPVGAAMPQEKINRLLVEHARAGRNVVRLKGGDPFVFGRGFEEVEACAAAGITAEIVPGLSSAIAAPAAISVPVTHRGVTHGFTVVSGHSPSSVDWAALARSGTTLVILMAMRTLPAIVTALRAAGLPDGTPAAVVSDAGRPGQREWRGTLATVAALPAPAVVVIGAVAGMPA